MNVYDWVYEVLQNLIKYAPPSPEKTKHIPIVFSYSPICTGKQQNHWVHKTKTKKLFNLIEQLQWLPTPLKLPIFKGKYHTAGKGIDAHKDWFQAIAVAISDGSASKAAWNSSNFAEWEGGWDSGKCNLYVCVWVPSLNRTGSLNLYGIQKIYCHH